MSEIIININTDNSAFDEDYGYEVARILRKLADQFENDNTKDTIMDLNGNVVGTLEVY